MEKPTGKYAEYWDDFKKDTGYTEHDPVDDLYIQYSLGKKIDKLINMLDYVESNTNDTVSKLDEILIEVKRMTKDG